MSNEMQLSESAKAALLAAPSFNQGARPVGTAAELKELRTEGLVGDGGGLTRKGSIWAERFKRNRELDLFGL
jgi:hypothetical protein